MQHVRALRDHFIKATLKDMANGNKIYKVFDKAHFIDAKIIQVNEALLNQNFLIVVVSTPTINHDWKNKLDDTFITSDQVFELEKLSKFLAIIGSRAIAIELAQVIQCLSVKTTVFVKIRKTVSLTSSNLQNLAQTKLRQNSRLNSKYYLSLLNIIKIKSVFTLIKIEKLKLSKLTIYSVQQVELAI